MHTILKLHISTKMCEIKFYFISEWNESTHAMIRLRKIEKSEILGFGTFLRPHNAICSKNEKFWKKVLKFCPFSNFGVWQSRNMTLLRKFEFQDISDTRIPDSGHINICTNFEWKFHHKFRKIQIFCFRPRKFEKNWIFS